MANKLLYADDLVFMSETMEDLKERFVNWKCALKSKDLTVNTRKTKVVVSWSEGGLFRSMIDPCGICGRRVVANLVLCPKCGNRVDDRCAKIEKVTARFGNVFYLLVGCL